MLISLWKVLPRLVNISIDLKQFFTYDVNLFSLLNGQITGFLYDAMHIHQNFRHVVDLNIALLQYFVLYFKITIDLVVLDLLLEWVLFCFFGNLLILSLSSPIWVVIHVCILRAYWGKCGYLWIFWTSIQIFLMFLLYLCSM